MNLSVSLLEAQAPGDAPCEIVERKGRGHPDSICDALAENLSLGLSRFYLERFGAILHHNVDKALLIGGAARPAFGGGELVEPIEIILAGRATRRFRGVTVPVDELAVELGREWLGRNLRHIDPARDVRIVPRIRETSADLAELFLRGAQAGVPLANDTSFGAGFAPLDPLERAVLAVERGLCAASPEIGEDIKVLGVRSDERLELTVACAFVGRHVASLADYLAKKEKVRTLAAAAARKAVGGEVDVEVNTADGDSADSIYLTVTGLSAEAGDDGQIGRGNRVNGLITPYRPMSLEAAAGKNPVSHTGKLYNLLAERIARALTEEVAGVEEAYCWLLSRIGSPVTEPQLADVRLRLADPGAIDAVRHGAAKMVRAQLRAAPELWRDVLAGRCPVC
ncbi:MAG: S-adenosylmethionine synthase [Betaproteobacteria bacterium RIFCSPLOWO2_12_FULL_65_14]|nr:MAG: S-adenosylmethionine synthase [Betaproteobacteria bacterium RIFCSPLOWO2_12_FULL_65_14]